jgi:hypothetical protein
MTPLMAPSPPQGASSPFRRKAASLVGWAPEVSGTRSPASRQAVRSVWTRSVSRSTAWSAFCLPAAGAGGVHDKSARHCSAAPGRRRAAPALPPESHRVGSRLRSAGSPGGHRGHGACRPRGVSRRHGRCDATVSPRMRGGPQPRSAMACCGASPSCSAALIRSRSSCEYGCIPHRMPQTDRIYNCKPL